MICYLLCLNLYNKISEQRNSENEILKKYEEDFKKKEKCIIRNI